MQSSVELFASTMNSPGASVSGYILLFTIQIILLVIFGVYTDYDDDLRPRNGTQAEEGFIIPKYARKSDWVYRSRDVLLHIAFWTLHRFPRYSRDDFHRFRLPDDLPEALRLQRDWIKFVCGRALHPMGDFNARLFRNGTRHNQVSFHRYKSRAFPSNFSHLHFFSSLSRQLDYRWPT